MEGSPQYRFSVVSVMLVVMYSLCNAFIYQVFHNKTSRTALLTRFISKLKNRE